MGDFTVSRKLFDDQGLREAANQIEDANAGLTPVGNAFSITSTVEDNQQAPVWAVLPTGKVLAVRDGDDGHKAQYYSDTGEKIGDEFVLGNLSIDVDMIVGLPDGNFVVLDSGPTVAFRIYAPDGSVVQSTTTVATNSAARDIEVLDDGNFIVSYASSVFQSDGNNTSGSLARVYNPEGVHVGSEIQISTYAGGRQLAADIVPLQDGGFAAVYESNSLTLGGESDVFMRFFDQTNLSGDDYIATSSRAFLNPTRLGNQTEPYAVQLSNGNIAVTWMTDQSELSYNNTELLMMVFDESGRPLTSQVMVNGDIANDQGPGKLVALPDGSFIVAWQTFDLDVDGRGAAIAAQRYDDMGNPIGTNFIVNESAEGDQANVSMVATNAHLFFGWYDPAPFGDGDRSGSMGRLFEVELETNSISGDAAGTRINGSDGIDIISADDGNDTVRGGAGPDSISGGAGDDLLLGNAGGDTIYGGDGQDTIWAGTGDDGNDRVYGGDGRDVIGGSVGGDLLVGGAGSDTIFGGTGEDTLVAGDWAANEADTADTNGNRLWAGDNHDVLFGADGADMLGGGNGDDILHGAAGDDTIFAGLFGEDTLFGGDDNDLMFAGFSDDVVFGGDGDDEIYGGKSDDLIDGGDGDDEIYGGQGWDTITGGAGNDILYPGESPDILVFATGSGNDTLFGLNTGEDTLNLADSAADFNSIDDVIAAVTTAEGGVLIDLGDGDSLLIRGLSLEDLSNASYLL